MGRSAKDANLDTKQSRGLLAVRDAPYWHRITEGYYLGYVKSQKGGTWIAKRYDPDGSPKRPQIKIGVADDIVQADGVNVMDFKQAQKFASNWKPEQWGSKVGEADTENAQMNYKVKDACRDYLLEYVDLGKKDLQGATATINAHILVPELEERPVPALTRKELKAWHRKLAKKELRRRGKKDGSPANRKKVPKAEAAKKKGMEVEEYEKECERARKATANRILTCLKAVLNYAVTEEFVDCSRDPWANVQPFPNTDKARTRFLEIGEQLAIVKASLPGLRPLIQAALFTGARYGELAKLKVSSFNATTGLLYVIPDTKTYTERYISLSPEAQEFFTEITKNRPKSERLLLKNNGKPWGKNHHVHDFKKCLEKAAKNCPSLSNPPTFHEFRHTYASGLIQGGAHLMVVAAQLGHKTTLMVEKHYGHLRKEHVTAVVQATTPVLGITNPKLFEPEPDQQSEKTKDQV
jgi:integrase